MLTLTAKRLTSQYADKTLPEGDYYFQIAGGKPMIGRYIPPQTQDYNNRANKNLPPPQPKIYRGAQTFIGTLKTIVILNEVPQYKENTNEFEC